MRARRVHEGLGLLGNSLKQTTEADALPARKAWKQRRNTFLHFFAVFRLQIGGLVLIRSCSGRLHCDVADNSHCHPGHYANLIFSSFPTAVVPKICHDSKRADIEQHRIYADLRVQLKKRTAPGATPPSEDVEDADAGGATHALTCLC